MKTTFPKERLRDVLWGDEGEIISNEITDTGRWSLHRTLIFKLDGKTWLNNFTEGATENCDERPWEFDDDEIECIEVVPVQKTVTVYVPISETVSK